MHRLHRLSSNVAPTRLRVTKRNVSGTGGPPVGDRNRTLLSVAALLAAGYGIYYWKNKRAPTLAQGEKLVKAVCVLLPHGDSEVRGEVVFEQKEEGKTHIEGKIVGLAAGRHGFHIHESGDLRRAGGHYNPFNKNHGGPDDNERHVGDLGNVYSDGKSMSTFKFSDDQVRLSGTYSVIGRSLVIHRDEDDLGKGGHNDSKTNGHSGPRLACGVIGLAERVENPDVPV